MAFCELCNNLSITKLWPPNIYHHAANYAVLEASAEHCRLCKMMHWCIGAGNEREHSPQLHFEGATDAISMRDGAETRNASSVKLQILPGSWHPTHSQNGFRYVGLWMQSKFMLTDMVLSVQEGTGFSLRISDEADTYLPPRR